MVGLGGIQVSQSVSQGQWRLTVATAFPHLATPHHDTSLTLSVSLLDGMGQGIETAESGVGVDMQPAV